jgi:hypothetical protein
VSPKTETIKVSRSQLPVGEGKTKASNLEARMKANLDSLPEESRNNISNYKEMNNADQLKMAADYVRKNPDDAMEVLKGNKPAPKGLLTNAIYLAAKETGKGDPELALKLASLKSTRMGQEIQILRNADPFSPDNFIKSVNDARIEAWGREKIKTAQGLEAKEGVFKESVRKSIASVKVSAWTDFVQKLQC